MADNKANNKLLNLIAPYAVTGLIAGLLAVFSDRITMGPDKAGFWMVLILGMGIGVSLIATAQYFGKGKQPSE
jgi:hypothetical protein